MSRFLILAVLVLSGWLAGPNARAAFRDDARTILVVSDRDTDAQVTSAYPVLTYLGLMTERADARAALPALGGRSDIRGVLIWLDDGDVADPSGFTSWVQSAVANGIPVILMGHLPKVENTFGLFAALGLIHAHENRSYGYDLSVVETDASLTGFQRRIKAPFPVADIVRPMGNAEARAVLVLQRRSNVEDRTAPLVITSTGAFAGDGYALWRSADGVHQRWLIDPYAWFHAAFRLGAMPVADTTTVNARRRSAIALAPAARSDAATAQTLAEELASAGVATRLFGAPTSNTGQAATWTSPTCQDNAAHTPESYTGMVTLLAASGAPYRTHAYDPIIHVCAGDVAAAKETARALAVHASGVPLSSVEPVLDGETGNVSFERLDDGIWRIKNRGEVQTVRFDDAAHLRVEWGKTEGVMGAARVGAALYVSLDPDAPEPVVAITNLPWVVPPFPVLVEARWHVSGLKRTVETADMNVSGNGPGDMVWSVEPHSKWEIRFTPSNGETWRYKATVSDDGLLSFALPPLAGSGGTVHLEQQDLAEVGP